jgi:hypothetical protein
LGQVTNFETGHGNGFAFDLFAMIFSKVDLPEPFKPSTPILAPGKKLREMSLRI